MDKKQDIIFIVKRFYSEAQKNLDISKVILFGSYSTNNAVPESDIDVAVILNKEHPNNFLDISSKLWNIAAKIDIRIEPTIFFSEDYDPNEPASIYNHILSTGIDIKIN